MDLGSTSNSISGQALGKANGAFGRGARHRSAFQRTQLAIRDRFFALSSHLRRGHAVSATTVTLYFLVDFLQMMSFAFWAPASLPWRPYVRWMGDVAGAFNFALPITRAAAASAVVVVVAVVLAAATAAGLAAHSVARGSPTFLWLARPVRAYFTLAPWVLAVPFATLLTAGTLCASGHADMGAYAGASSGPVLAAGGDACGVGGHAAMAAVCGVCAVVHTALCALAQLVLWDPKRSAGDALARAHGRVHAAEVVAKCGAAALVVLIPSPSTSGSLIAAIVIAVGSGVAAMHAYYLPCESMRTNTAAVTSSMLVAWSGVSLLFTVLENDSETSAGGAVLLFGMAFVVAVAPSVITWRRRQLRRARLEGLTSPFVVEVRVRLQLHEAARQRQRDALLAGEMGAAYAVVPSGEQDGVGDDGDDDDGGVGGERSWQAAERHLQAAVRRMPGTAWLHVFLGLLYENESDNQLGPGEVRRAVQLGGGLDVGALDYHLQRLASEREGGPGGQQAANAQSYILFEHHMESAKLGIARCLRAHIVFWQELTQLTPDLDRLFRLGRMAAQVADRTQSHFDELLRINERSVSGLRLFASFMQTIKNDGTTAKELLNKADLIEDEDMEDEGDDADLDLTGGDGAGALDIFNDRNALFVISGTPKGIGTILSVNPAACKLVGMRRRRLMGKNINMIVPHPFAPLHDGFLLRYLRTRTGKFMNRTRLVFHNHVDGLLRPARLTLKETAAEDAMSMGTGVVDMRFMGAVRPLKSESGFCIADADGLVTGISATSASHFGADPDLVKQRALRVEDLLPGKFDAAESSWAEENFRETVEGRLLSVAVSRMEGPGYNISIIRTTCLSPTDAGASDPSNVPGSQADGNQTSRTRLRSSRSGVMKVPTSSTPAQSKPRPQAAPTGVPVPTPEKAPFVPSILSPLLESSTSSVGSGVGSDVSLEGGEENKESAEVVIDKGEVQVARLPSEAAAVTARSRQSAPIGSGSTEIVSTGDAVDTASKGSSSQAASSRGRGLRSIVVRKNNGVDPSLLRLGRVLFFLIVMLTLMSLSLVTVMQILFDSWIDHLDDVASAERRRFYAASQIVDLSTLERFATGELPRPSHYEKARRNLPVVIERFLSVHDSLFKTAVPESKTIEYAVIERTATGERRNVSMNLWTLGIRLSSHASQAWEFSLEDFNATSSGIGTNDRLANHLAFVLENGVNTLLPAMETTSNRYFDLAHDRLRVILSAIIAMAASAAFLLLIAFGFGYVPTLRAVEHSKRRLLVLLVEVPQPLVRQLVKDLSTSLRALEGEAEDEDLSDAEGNDDGMILRAHDSSSMGTVKQHGHARGQHRRTGPKYTATYALLWRNVGRLSPLFLCAGAFIVGIVLWGLSMINAADLGAFNVQKSGARLASSRVAHLQLREYLTEPLGSAAYQRASLEIDRELERIETLERALVFGNDEESDSGLDDPSVSVDQRSIMLQDGCVGSWEDATQQARCPTFHEGVMSHGLHAALHAYVAEVRAAKEAADAFGQARTLSGSDAVVAVEQFDAFFLSEALEVSLALYVSHIRDFLGDQLSLTWLVASIFALLNLSLYAVVYRPILATMNDDISHTRSMLLLLPESALSVVPSFREYVKEEREEM